MKATFCFFLIAATLSSSAVAQANFSQLDSTSSAVATTKTTSSSSLAEREAAVPRNPLKDAYFGETHLHTGVSMDAFIAGNRLKPSDAYRFAKGEEVKVNGIRHRIKRPLDFAAVTDHSEFLGESYSLMNPGAPGYDHPLAKAFREASDLETALKLYGENVLAPLAGGGNPHPPFFQGIEAIKSTWQQNYQAAEDHYDPGKFTTIHAYEWTSAPDGSNQHRNVLFRDANVPEVPFSSVDGDDPEELWQWMSEQRAQGRRLFAMPHNANQSKGLLFTEVTLSGEPVDRAYAQTRAAMEPLIEMMQVKGNSEVVPQFWQADEFADFENAESLQQFSGRVYKKQNFVRYGLDRGLKYREQLGVNPFKYGFVGGTDSHNGSPSNVAEDNYAVGSHGLADRKAEDRSKNMLEGEMLIADTNPGAITGVWAEANTRADIWDAMAARETFATSGPRIRVRAFAGNRFESSYESFEAMIRDGYEKGVPMGSDYQGNTAPQLLLMAAKDPDGPNLDRIQVIKGWVEDGEMKDRVYNAVASGNRLRQDGTVEPIEAPVDMKTGAFNTEKGSAQLMGVWTDPDFDPKQHAYYYVRVLQLPTARWTLWDQIREGVAYPEEVKLTVVERAWGSPFWYEAQ